MHGLKSSSSYRTIQAAGQLFKRKLYPPECLTCRHSVSEYFGFCGACWAQLHFVPDKVCQYCAAPLMGTALGPLVCESCWEDPPPWDQAMCYMYYKGLGRHAVLQLKHSDRLDYARGFGQRMGIKWRDELPHGAWIVPIPMPWRRFVQRGSNSANELAKWIAKKGSFTFAPEVLHRTRFTPTLDDRSAEERHALLDGVFAISAKWRHAVKGQKIVLVDDVMTSGATLRHASVCLRETGVENLQIIVLARAMQTA